MNVTDPIADMLTRIRNANMKRHVTVDIPASKIKKEIANVLLNEGYIQEIHEMNNNKQGVIRITLKYVGKERVISGIKRISKPGLRVYVGSDELPTVLGGLGIAIVSTPKGIITDKTARQLGVGGEVLAFVW